MITFTTRQLGLSLIELMVAVSIGLLITAGVGYLLIGSLSSYRTQSDQARLQETGRLILDIMGRDIAKAGYVEISPVYSDPKTEFSGIPIQGENGVISQRVTERKANTDYLRLSFDGSTDCTGNSVTNNPVVNEYYVDVNDQLMCAGDSGSGVLLAEGVEDMQILYGIDNNDHDGVAVERYTHAPTDWSKVITVQVCLLLRSTNNGVTVQAQQYQDCAGVNQNAPDLRLRRTLRATLQLRNRT